MIGSAYLMAGMPLEILTALVKKNGVGLHPKYLGRLLFLTQAGFWSSFLREMECRKRPEHAATPLAHRNPLFIVGQWRSGTTYLHQLLHHHPALTAPTFYECCFPDSMFFSEPYVVPVMSPFVGGTRPMDSVRAGLDQPHEDEDALFRCTGLSPLEQLVWPDGDEFFLLHRGRFLPEGEQLGQWKRTFKRFVERVHTRSRRRVVLKNAFHSVRVPILAELFPECRFIYIHRHPEEIVPSAINMWSIFGQQNTLRPGFVAPSVETIVELYDHMESLLVDDLNKLPTERKITVAFERLEADPLSVIETICTHFSIGFNEDARLAIASFQRGLSHYRKNSYNLTDAHALFIRSRLHKHYERLGYRESSPHVLGG